MLAVVSPKEISASRGAAFRGEDLGVVFLTTTSGGGNPELNIDLGGGALLERSGDSWAEDICEP